jgi:hypothetical protein
LSRWSPEVRKGALLGLIIGGILFLALGGGLGYLNRAQPGALAGAASGLALGVLIGGGAGALVGAVMPTRQARALVVIETSGGNGGHFAPGECVSGYVHITPQNNFDVDAGTIYLVCRGFFGAEREQEGGAIDLQREAVDYVLEQQDFSPLSRLRQGVSHRYPFSFILPEDALSTHHGYVCATRWMLHAVLDAPGEEPVRGQQEVLVHSNLPAIPQSARGYQSVNDKGYCHLTLTLPQAVVAEGQRVQAEVRLAALETFAVDEIRAVLLRIENTAEGLDHMVYVGEWDPATAQFHGERTPGGSGTTYVWLEDEVRLAHDVRFEIAETETFKLTLDVPAQWRPTMNVPQGSVHWKLGVIVSSPQYPQVRVFHEVIVFTGMAELASLLKSQASAPRPPKAGGPTSKRS